MTRLNYLGYAVLLTILACTNSSQYGGGAEPGINAAKKPGDTTTKAATDQNDVDGTNKATTQPHEHDHPPVTPTDTNKEQTDSKPAVPAAPTPPPTNLDSNEVEFTIPAGTGRRAWNSASDPIRIRQGQTLVVKNADSQMHWIHTNFAPFPHPFQGIAPGASARYRINGTSAAGMRDHLTGAPIYMTISR
jgi:hypothetical protein